MFGNVLRRIFIEIDRRQKELDFECFVSIEKPIDERVLVFNFRHFYGKDQYVFQRHLHESEITNSNIPLESYLDLFFAGVIRQRADVKAGLITK